MKIITVLLLLLTLGFGSEYKKLGLIPANVNYDKESVEEFSELIYDALANAIAEYNFSQKSTSDMYRISDTAIIVRDNKRYKETLVGDKRFKKEIKESHHKIKKDYLSYMKKRHLQKLMLMDFSTSKILHVMRKSRGMWSVAISISQYSLNAKPIYKKFIYKYNAQTCELADKSSVKLNSDIAGILSK